MRQSWISWNRLVGGLILACLPLASPAADELPAATRLDVEARSAAAAGGPLIVIFSRADCSFCRAVKRDFLLPLAADPRYGKHLLIREIRQDTELPVTDFAGKATTHAAFAAAEQVRLVPVVAFYGPGGRVLHAPIIGARLPDFYRSYLEDAVEQSTLALKKP